MPAVELDILGQHQQSGFEGAPDDTKIAQIVGGEHCAHPVDPQMHDGVNFGAVPVPTRNRS